MKKLMSTTIYNRLKLVYTKKRIFPIILIVQNILLSLLVLIYLNLIVSEGKSMGELNYMHIKIFYAITVIIMFVLPTVYSPYFLAKSVNELVKNNITINLFSSKAKSINIIYPCFLCGFFSVFVLTFSALPIVIVSFYFGGVSIYRLFAIIVYLLFYIILISSISLAISTRIKEPNLSITLAYILNVLLLLIHIFALALTINSIILLCSYSFIIIMLFFVLVAFSKKTHIFSINL